MKLPLFLNKHKSPKYTYDDLVFPIIIIQDLSSNKISKIYNTLAIAKIPFKEN
jgi:hypothetical protein